MVRYNWNHATEDRRPNIADNRMIRNAYLEPRNERLGHLSEAEERRGLRDERNDRVHCMSGIGPLIISIA